MTKQNSRTRKTKNWFLTGGAVGCAMLAASQIACAQNVSVTETTPVQTTATQPVAATVILPAQSTPDLAAPLTLEDSILIALHNHGDPGAAQLQAQGANKRITTARSSYYPQISATVDYNFTNTHASTSSVNNFNNSGTGTGIGTGFSTSNSITNSTISTGIAITQNIFDGGKTKQQVRAAKATAQNALGSFGDTRSSLAYQVAQAFYEQLRQQKFVAQYRGQVQLAQQQVAQVQAQIEAGTVARVDIQTVQVTLSQARFNLATAQNSLATSRVGFRNALGLERGAALQLQESDTIARIATPVSTPDTSTPAGSTPAAPATAADLTSDILAIAPPEVPLLEALDAYIAQAQRLRPDLLQARAAVQQNEAMAALAKIEQRPQVSASAGYNLDPRSTGDRGFQFGLGFSVPIFDGGGKRATTSAARDDLAASKINLEQAQKDAAADVETSYTDISGQVDRIANARVLVEQAQTNLQTATERYQLGLGIVLDVVNAQTQLFSAQTSATQAVYDYEIARANLDRAIGRFAWADPGQAAPESAPTTIPVALKSDAQ